jgi:hypothetical protein
LPLACVVAAAFRRPGFGPVAKFRAGNGGFGTAINAILPGAYHAKIFQKYGLEAEYIALESGTIGMQTLIANELQVVFTTGALAVTANLQEAIRRLSPRPSIFPFADRSA